MFRDCGFYNGKRLRFGKRDGEDGDSNKNKIIYK